MHPSREHPEGHLVSSICCRAWSCWDLRKRSLVHLAQGGASGRPFQPCPELRSIPLRAWPVSSCLCELGESRFPWASVSPPVRRSIWCGSDIAAPVGLLLDPHCLQLPMMNSWVVAEIQGADSCGNSVCREPHGPVLSPPTPFEGTVGSAHPTPPLLTVLHSGCFWAQHSCHTDLIECKTGGKPPPSGTPSSACYSPKSL